MLRSLTVLVLAALAVGCVSSRKPEKPVLLGETNREAVEAVVPDWVAQVVASEIDSAAAQALVAVPPGAEVTILFGTWCGDSRREVSRFWRVLDEVGGEVGFPYRLIGVSRDKTGPTELVAGQDLRYVPTFIVRRDGVEVGRIVESSPNGLETDLLALLEGRAQGLLTLREDLLPAPEAPATP